MRRYNFGATILGTLAAAFLAALTAGDARADTTPQAYSWVPQDQKEFISSPEYIQTVALSGAPMQIWEALEHGERVECLACIPIVAPLMYSENPQNREIAAWWLRRRIIGVFGNASNGSPLVYRPDAGDAGDGREPDEARVRGVGRRRVPALRGHLAAGEGAHARQRRHWCASTRRRRSDASTTTAAARSGKAMSDSGRERPHRRSPRRAASTRVHPDVHVAVTKTKLIGLERASSGVARPCCSIRCTQGTRALLSMRAWPRTTPDVDVRIAACHALGQRSPTRARIGCL